ncbi:MULTISPECIES: LamG-like jellyroll fold domain-containing protein [unclassified Streptomyces]|uniref:LamG-like jellyroll fold domain-containing protein n=1 Tax=unclassified Streptomyces TaxID=2593676 RepID=UPI00341FA48D
MSAVIWPAAPAQAEGSGSQAGVAELSEGQQALVQAQASGDRVEVIGERSESTTVFANPDGFTFTLEESAVPVRVRKPGGSWQAPDATLEVRPDGTVAPKAAAVEMAFSGGGESQPLVKISERGRSLQLGWPGNLPTPELNGASALYPEVLPGVDLKVAASVEGFQHVLVVKTAEAAASEKLEKIDYSLKSDGLDVLTERAGNLVAVDDDGNRVFRAPPAQMWDSASALAEQPSSSSFKTASVRTTAEGFDFAESGAASSKEMEPAPGDTVTGADVKVTTDSLSVVPDADMLSGTHESAFPLYIDPTVTWSESERTLLRSDGYESYGWGNGDDGLGKGAGECGTWGGYYCGPGYVQRLYFEFSPASLKGKKVLDATFRVTEPWAFQCDPRWVDLVRTPGNISSSTTWTSRPQGGWDTMGDRNVSAGRGSLCDPDSPDAPIEFNDNPDETNENLTPTVQSFAAGKFDRLTLMIKAHDESDTSAWKRFKNDAVLAVDFVGLPAKPTGIGLVTGSGTVCETSESDPAIVSDPTPSLTATPQTAAGGESGAQLRVAMSVDKKASDGTWASAFAEMERPTSGYVGDNVKLTASAPTLAEGPLYRYRSWTRSYYNSGNSQLPGPSNASTTGWCYFKVDPTAPKAPKITIGSPYTECTTNNCQAKGGPGQKATFTFAPATGDANNVAYQYRLSGAAAWSTAVNGSTVTANITPAKSGTLSVYVRAKDVVGRWGAQNAVDFLVATGAGPVGRWHFDEAGGAAVDAAAADGRQDAALGGNAVRDDRGRRGLITHDAQSQPLENAITDKSLSLNGTSGYAATNAPVLETRSAYTLSAWVRLDSTDEYASVLSQHGPGGNPFAFWYSSQLKTWFFGVLEADGSGFTGQRSAFAAQTGVWTHLAGTYDPAGEELKFYVDGRLQGSEVTPAVSWSSDTPLQIGRRQTSSGYTYYFPGSIDEVAVWQRVLTHEEIRDEARLLTSEDFAGAELVADWSPGQGSGTSIADTTSGYGKKLTLTGAASIDDDAIVLDGGVNNAATAPGPLVNDHSSFTVSTLVKLDGAKLADKEIGYTGQVLGQRTVDGSAWGLWYELTGKETVLDEETLEERTEPVGTWHFGRLNADGTFSSVVSDETAALDSLVRLTGIYDSLEGKISLYLGHNQNDDAKAYTVELGSGDFAIGKGFTNGAWRHYLPARVAEVRLWAGAMASGEQIDYRVGD